MKRIRWAINTGDYRPSVLAYVAVVSGSSLVLWSWLVARWGQPNLWAVLFFWGLHMVAHMAPIEVHVGRTPVSSREKRRPLTISGGGVLLLTAVFATDPATAATVALVPVFALRRTAAREDVVRKVFNTGQEVIYAGGAAAVYAIASATFSEGWRRLLAVGLALTVGAVLNGALVSGVVAIEQRLKPFQTAASLLWPFVHSIVLGGLAFLVATLYRESGPLAALLIFTPLFVLAQARRAKLEFDDAQEGTLRAFVRAVELKDPYTSRHSERVAEVAVQLHRQLGASEEFIRRRFYGALMHDVGKVAVPGWVLSKPRGLTGEEFELVKAHASIGADVAAEVDALADLVPEILYHHERLNGRGYPIGLSGDEIPHEARVLAVADVYEALTSDRPYRGALSNEQAMSEIRGMAGTELDPATVAALEQLLEEGYVFAPLRPVEPREFEPVDQPRAEQA